MARWEKPFAWVPEAKRLLEDGASYREVSKTVNIDRRHIQKTLPGSGWTKKEGGQFRKLLAMHDETLG